ncbi:hypothetical protein [Reyranella sp.]|uniref:hypothetical protein n=1 Tax=Reyranella sp. TaxID=1929291 RepID=UPI003D127985
MSRFVPSLILVFGLMAAGAASARPSGQEGVDAGVVVTQQAQVQTPPSAREAIEKSKESAAERARAIGPELKALRDEMAAQVGEVRKLIDKRVDEAEAKARSYALMAAGGLFVLMVLASVLGGVIVALLFRRNRA